jgi:hypothetical protein
MVLKKKELDMLANTYAELLSGKLALSRRI